MYVDIKFCAVSCLTIARVCVHTYYLVHAHDVHSCPMTFPGEHTVSVVELTECSPDGSHTL